jgi:hypothetical protein
MTYMVIFDKFFILSRSCRRQHIVKVLYKKETSDNRENLERNCRKLIKEAILYTDHVCSN